ncbi:Putative peptidoglycan binding domain protein [Synechococcus sp. PCC 7335]|uniref:peptidoglycan-binding protein n=1 Tax=Synechococcus sp. (strain ATCC 29403 / PCC 7335) TaxID=91464 RepID=UPI00017EDA01|nr:peptidoglycan-binding protein [Synechococcus sp. PCC 7335]EDX82829.1 Putative peptidoglycan binding domain protein [Synechococcus sp. PCC 7335]
MSHPNGVWIWVLSEIDRNYLEKLKERGVERVYLKVFDGKSNPKFWRFQCTSEIIERFNNEGIEVYGWGYHYGTQDITAQVSAIQEALDCGISGYVIDIETEAENVNTHPYVGSLLEQLRQHIGSRKLGYTSFGHPQFHPNIPWKLLDQHCDLAFPQIYFEKFRFASTNEDEVQACLKAHRDLNLQKPILPIWGSESDARAPSSAGELQSYLARFPGSSVWRIPRVGERGQAWNLSYKDKVSQPVGGNPSEFELPSLSRILRRGSVGEDVKALQRALNALAFEAGNTNGEFNTQTERAVTRFQQKAGITIDGEVGPETWSALGGELGLVNRPDQGILQELGNFAEREANRDLQWTSPTSEAEKYLEIFREPMNNLGQIGTAKVFYDWCGAFVYYCCREVGIQVPIQPNEFWATMALVESWKFWARRKGYWFPKEGFIPKRGDILTFDWDGDRFSNHIGIVRNYTRGSNVIGTSEGNKANRSGNFDRDLRHVEGFIRISI